ncbi:hypothetical protein TNCV_2742591 [Trichonephila clavipes]|nr:hypothetical protein TNCV_2742591 [Trichonephila clavipes]
MCDAEELSHFIQEAKQLLAMACFDLRGWEHTLEPGQIHLAEPTQVLGLLWNRNEDVFFFVLQIYRNCTTASLDVRVCGKLSTSRLKSNKSSVSELDAAEKVLMKIVQQETLKNENVESRLKKPYAYSPILMG